MSVLIFHMTLKQATFLRNRMGYTCSRWSLDTETRSIYPRVVCEKSLL